MYKKTDWTKLEPKICNYCKNKYYHRINEKAFQYKGRKYCGNICKMKALADGWKNKSKYSRKYKKEIRKCFYCGKEKLVPPSLSKRPFCNRLCMSKWMSEKQRGQNHWNWQGGITEKPSRDILYPGYKEWRKSVYKRDGYKCILCGNDKSGELQAHHIKPRNLYKDLILEISNGLTVCKKCHKEIHYGKKI